MIEIPAIVGEALGGEPKEPQLFERALTHGSHGRDTYERLEFLGDRVLGLVIASWLYERFPGEPEGKMSRRYNALVARETCAEIGRALDLPRFIRLGKQAREDQAQLSGLIQDALPSVDQKASSARPTTRSVGTKPMPPAIVG